MKDSVAIIGAGPAGLTAARALKMLNIPFRVFERHSTPGGIWDLNNPGTPMYKTAHFISSKTMSGHKAFPMPDHYPDYPSRQQIFDYINNFADANGLRQHIYFNTTVQQIEKDGDAWQITTGDGTVEEFGWVILSSGSMWDPYQPQLKGEENFTGEIIHSVHYKEPSQLQGKRVLVVGAGNSGVDIACDAAFSSDKAFISTRRGYHILPKHVFGMPADVFGEKTGGGPMWMKQWVFGKMLRLLTGDVSKWGLQKPDHPVLSSHPIVNSQLLHYLQHGDIIAKKDIDHLDGEMVHFVDGSAEKIDLIILATGYNSNIPYMDESYFDWKDKRPLLYLRMFNSRHPTLFANSFIETNGGIYSLFDDMSYLIARTIETQRNGGEKAAALNRSFAEPAPDLLGSIKMIGTARHTEYVNKETYKKALRQFAKRWDFLPAEKFYREK